MRVMKLPNPLIPLLIAGVVVEAGSTHPKPANAPHEHVPETDYSEPYAVGNDAIDYVMSGAVMNQHSPAFAVARALPTKVQNFTLE